MTAPHADPTPQPDPAVVRCPIHSMPDCSPLLNGCSIPDRLHAAYKAGAADAAARLAAVEAEEHGPGGFWTRTEWSDWSNRLAVLIPEDDTAGNLDGAQESIIEDTLAMYVRDRAALSAVEADVEYAGRQIAHAMLDERVRPVGSDRVFLALHNAQNALSQVRAALSATAPDAGEDDAREADRAALAWWASAWADARQALAGCKDHMDEHAYDELSTILDDEPNDHLGEAYPAPDAGQREAQGPPTAQDLPAGVDVAEVGAAAGLLLKQIALDRGAPYWHDRADHLDAAQGWLESVADWSATLAPLVR